MTSTCLYEERVSSTRTEVLFVALSVLFLLLLIWRATTSGLTALTLAFLCFFGFFLFYSVNYRTLIIRMAPASLELRFGVFSWKVPWETIRGCHLDPTPMWRIGGAGVHFTMIGRRYRIFLNFLEFPRVVLNLERPRGLIRDIAFTTRRPDEVLAAVAERIESMRTTAKAEDGL